MSPTSDTTRGYGQSTSPTGALGMGKPPRTHWHRTAQSTPPVLLTGSYREQSAPRATENGQRTDPPTQRAMGTAPADGPVTQTQLSRRRQILRQCMTRSAYACRQPVAAPIGQGQKMKKQVDKRRGPHQGPCTFVLIFSFSALESIGAIRRLSISICISCHALAQNLPVSGELRLSHRSISRSRTHGSLCRWLCPLLV